MNLSRRQFLLLGGAGGLALLGTPLAVYLRELYLDGSVPPETRAKLAAFFKERKGAGQIGRSFLEENHDLNHEGRLARHIIEKLGPRGNPPESAGLTASLRRAHIRDWDQGQTVLVGGWVLTETEALLCALSALLH